MSNVLVTGGAGFIGSHTADRLLAEGHRVRVLDNLCEPVHRGGRPDYLSEGAELMVGDVRSRGDWERALDGIDAVYHFAAYQDLLADFSTFFHTNTVGTALLYEVAVEKSLPLQRVVVASSQAVYGEGRYRTEDGRLAYPDIRPAEQLARGEWELAFDGGTLTPVWTDETRVNPQNQYAISKYTQELVAINLGRRYGIPTTCLRYSIVQGPRQSFRNAYSGACRIFSLAYFLGLRPPVFEDGLQLRDFVCIEDVVAANVLMLDCPDAAFQCFNVGGGRAYTVLEFAEIAAEVFGRPFEVELQGNYRFGDTRHILSDVSRLRALGWAPLRDARDSLIRYRDWLATQEVSADILDVAARRMRGMSVVRSSRDGARQ
jgi:dTDP-L-rhamnose 4-epimerase